MVRYVEDDAHLKVGRFPSAFKPDSEVGTVDLQNVITVRRPIPLVAHSNPPFIEGSAPPGTRHRGGVMVKVPGPSTRPPPVDVVGGVVARHGIEFDGGKNSVRFAVEWVLRFVPQRGMGCDEYQSIPSRIQVLVPAHGCARLGLAS